MEEAHILAVPTVFPWIRMEKVYHGTLIPAIDFGYQRSSVCSSITVSNFSPESRLATILSDAVVRISEQKK